MDTQTANPMLLTAAQKVADLWADQLQKPLNKDNGDSSNDMLFAISAINTMKAQESISPAKIEVFKTALIDAIIQDLGNGQYNRTRFGVDYHPDPILTDAALEAGIDAGCFPWKSTTGIYLDKNEINYRFGYSGGWQTIEIVPA